MYGFSQENKTAFDVTEPFYKKIYDSHDVIENFIYGPDSKRLKIEHKDYFTGGGGQKKAGDYPVDIKKVGETNVREMIHYGTVARIFMQ
jgi:hypothetical protein